MGKDYCAIPFCHNFNGKIGRFDKPVKLPTNRYLRSAWIRAISRKDYRPTRNTYVCSDHFPNGDGRTWQYKVPTLNLPQREPTPCKFRVTQNSNRHSCTTYNDAMVEDSRDDVIAEVQDGGIGNDEKFDAATAWSMSQMFHSYLASDIHDGTVYEQEQEDTKVPLIDERNQVNNSHTQTEKQPEISMRSISEQDVPFYTGLPDRKSFYALLETCMAHGVEKYLGGSRTCKLTLEDELFLTLLRLRQGLLLKDLSYRFHISESQVSRIFRAWITYLYNALQSIVFIPEAPATESYIPDYFKTFSDTKIVLDCTEIFVETPSSLENKSNVYSNYKSHSTFKALIGINMTGAVILVSKLFGGCISDVEITRRSGLYDQLHAGDAVMVDKGFIHIRPDLLKLGVKLYVPPLNSKGQLTKEEVTLTRRIASARIHVERKMEQIKNFRIFQGVLPLSLSASVNEIFLCVLHLQIFFHL